MILTEGLTKQLQTLGYSETHYLNTTIDHLHLNDDYTLTIFNTDHPILPKNKINIGIHISNEGQPQTNHYHKFDYIFRFYHPEICDNQKIFHINIGYNSSGDIDIDFNNLKPLNERQYNIFF